jgi:hypothetical protein
MFGEVAVCLRKISGDPSQIGRMPSTLPQFQKAAFRASKKHRQRPLKRHDARPLINRERAIFSRMRYKPSRPERPIFNFWTIDAKAWPTD